MPEITINLHPSKQFISLILIAMMGSLVICCYLPLIMWGKMSLMAVAMGYGGYQLWKYGLLKHTHSIIRLKTQGDVWELSDQTAEYSAKLCGDSTVTTWLSVLRFTLPDSRYKRSCVIFKDSVEFDQYRCLLVALQSVKI